MADKVTGAAGGATGKAQGATGAAGGITDKVKGATDGVLGSIEGWGNWIAAKGMSLVDSVFPPESRAAFLAKIQSFMLSNPKLSVRSHPDEE